jgi:transcriptional regulator with XRE-family HTH domain
MPSELGRLLRAARKKRGLGLRELARAVDKSPSLLSRLECDEKVPATSPETLRAIARKLELDEDRVLVLAMRTEEMAPKTELEYALYRKVKNMRVSEQKQWLRKLEEND